MPEHLSSHDNLSEIREILNRHYPFSIHQVEKHRDWIGAVYFVQGASGQFVWKLYRPFHRENALNTIGILRFLEQEGYPAARICPTQEGAGFLDICTPQGPCVALLYNRAQGTEPQLPQSLAAIGRQCARLHLLMQRCPAPMLSRGKEHLLGRYLAFLKRVGFPQSKLEDLSNYADELWGRLQSAQPGFCHGDFHCGNMLETPSGEFVLLDFDAAGLSYPILDAATLCDGTDYFHFDPSGYGRTGQNLEQFLEGYTRETSLTRLPCVYDAIALRHYDIQATIADCQGYSLPFLEEQHAWLMQWRALCEQRMP